MVGAAASPAGPAHPVRVTFAGRQWPLAVGATLTIGRGRDCGVVLPDDDHLSRRAASLHVLGDCALVRNDSSSKPLVLRPLVGEDRVIEPGAATTSLPFDTFQLVFTGRAGIAVVVWVDVGGLAERTGSARKGSGPEPVATSRRTVTEPITLTAAQRRILVALCEPMLTRSGPEAVPATYAQIGERLTLRPQYVRNVVRSIREALAGHGVPGLTVDDSGETGEDFRWPLARWALRSGWVDVDDVPGTPSPRTPSG